MRSMLTIVSGFFAILALIPIKAFPVSLVEIKKLDFPNNVHSVRFSPRSSYFAVRTEVTYEVYNSKFKLLPTKPCKYLEDLHEYEMVFSPDERYLLLGNCQGKKTISILNLQTLKIEKTLKTKGSGIWVTSMLFSPDGEFFVAGSSHTAINIWKAKKGFKHHTLLKGYSIGNYAMAFSPNGEYLAIGNQNRFIRILNVKSGFSMYKIINTRKTENANFMNNISFSPNGKNFIASCSYNITTWKVERDFEYVNEKNINEALYNFGDIVFLTKPTNAIFVINSGSKIVMGKIEENFKVNKALHLSNKEINCIDYSPNGRYLAYGESLINDDMTVKKYARIFEVVD